jgi:hypothetical protein
MVNLTGDGMTGEVNGRTEGGVEVFSARGELKSCVTTTGTHVAVVTVFNGWAGVPGVSAVVVERVFGAKGTTIEAPATSIMGCKVRVTV